MSEDKLKEFNNLNDVIIMNDGDQDKVEKKESDRLRKCVIRMERKLGVLERYNEELRGQLRLMNEKFHLAKQFLYKTVSTQTDVSYSIEKQCSDLNGVHKEEFNTLKQINKVKQKEELDQFLEEIKSSSSDYYYDSKTKTYFSRSTGWYYYPESQAFYNPKDQRYYKYDKSTKQYNFLCNLDGSTTASTIKLVEEKPKSTIKNAIKDEIELEDGEINDECNHSDDVVLISDTENDELQISNRSNQFNPSYSSSSVIESKPVLHGEKTQLKSNINVNDDDARYLVHSLPDSLSKIAPCRLIVQQSDTLDVGSLLLISCMGGKIGQHSNCTVTIPDKTISQIHAEINYDPSRRIYTIQDLLSRNGTFVNGKKLGQLERNPLLHGDKISLANSCQLIAHIHQYRSFTCSECEPKNETKNNKIIYSNYVKTPKSIIKSLKRKYGLDTQSNRVGSDDDDDNLLPIGYRDRAAERQKTIGSDCPYEKTASGSALDIPLNERNKGFQLLQRMGWKYGQTLGKDSESGNLEPINVDIHYDRRGLGYKS